ncbi:MAG: DEAD/DEAH box helicase family protein [Candidatus Thorarchaeota archaeon]
MSKIDRKIIPREYQQLILNLIKFHTQKRKNVLLELDCGMGKRVITYELLTNIFEEKKVLLIVLSSSSLVETKDFLVNEYGGVKGFNYIGPGISGSYARKILKDARVVLSTPQKVANIIAKYSNNKFETEFDIVIINEVDKLVRRMGSNRVLVFPWNQLFEAFSNSIVVGMSGTMRDSHYVLDTDQMEIRKELDTLMEFLPNSEIIYMDYLAGTDVVQYTKETIIEPVPVEDSAIEEISRVIGEQLKEAYKEISIELQNEDPSYLASVKEIGPQALLQAPVSESLKGKAQSLTLIRKYLYSMVPQQFRKFIWKLEGLDDSILPVIPKKIVKVVEIAKQTNKTVVLCSYITTAKTIANYLTKEKIKSFVITGQIFDKNAILQQFRNFSGKAVLIMSPVGERDIDLPEADKLIIFDSVRTIKTVYQQLKRIRGGYGIFLYYNNTYEAKKVNSTIHELLERYPWSTKLADQS